MLELSIIKKGEGRSPIFSLTSLTCSYFPNGKQFEIGEKVKCFCPKAAFAGQVKVCRNDWFLEKRQNLDYFLKKKNSGFSYLLLWQENRKKTRNL